MMGGGNETGKEIEWEEREYLVEEGVVGERGMDLGQDFREIGDGMEGSMERWWKIVYMELIFMDYGGIVDVIEDWGDFGWVGIEYFLINIFLKKFKWWLKFKGIMKK